MFTNVGEGAGRVGRGAKRAVTSTIDTMYAPVLFAEKLISKGGKSRRRSSRKSSKRSSSRKSRRSRRRSRK